MMFNFSWFERVSQYLQIWISLQVTKKSRGQLKYNENQMLVWNRTAGP